MKILGIDPGLAIVGWGVIEYKNSKVKTIGYGSIETPAHIPTEERLLLIYKGLKQLIDTYHPDQMAVEELFFNNNAKTALTVGQARGVIILAAVQKPARYVGREYNAVMKNVEPLQSLRKFLIWGA